MVYVQVLVRWGIQHGTSVIPKASSEPHLRSNLDVLNWELSKDDFKAISSIKFQACTLLLSYPYNVFHLIVSTESFLEQGCLLCLTLGRCSAHV